MALWRRNNNRWSQRFVFTKPADGNGSLSKGTGPVYELFNRYHRIYYTDANGNTKATGWKPVYKYALVQTYPVNSGYMVISDGNGTITTSGTANVWPGCSVTCGGGSQTRTFECRRLESQNSDGSWNYTVKPDSYCTRAGIQLNANTGSYDTTTYRVCNTQPCTYYAHGGVDDRAWLWAKRSPTDGWTTLLDNSGFGGGKEHEHQWVALANSNVLAVNGNVYFKYRWHDTNCTSCGTYLRICKQYGADCSPWILYTGYLKSQCCKDDTYHWFVWNTVSNKIYRYACSGVSNNTWNNKDWSGGGKGSACWGYDKCDKVNGNNGDDNAWNAWGHLNCGTGEPF